MDLHRARGLGLSRGRRTVAGLAIACAACGLAVPGHAQSTATPASIPQRAAATAVAAATAPSDAVADAQAAAARARGLEQAGDADAARELYRRIVDRLEVALAGGRDAMLPPAQRFALWWTLASARLDWARTWAIAEGADVGTQHARYGQNLGRARAALGRALTADTDEALAAGTPITERTWKIHAAYAWLAVLEGDPAAARDASERAERLHADNPFQERLAQAQVELDAAAATQPITRNGQMRVPVPIRSLPAAGETSFLQAASPAFAAGEAIPPVLSAAGLQGTCPPAFTGSCYPVWFATHRRPIDPADPDKGFGDQPDDRVHFGKRIVLIPRSHRPGELGSPVWKRVLARTDDRITLGAQTHLDEAAFAAEIQGVLGRLDVSERDVLVFIHGYNVSFDKAARRAAQLGFDLRVPGITALYSWPSRGRAIDYFTDAERIGASEGHIADFLVRMARLAGPGHVHVIAHSMGNRGLLQAMHNATTRAALDSGVRFGTILLAAPDVDVDVFRQLAEIYPRVAANTTLYVGDSDKALAAIEWFSRDPRAGSAPPPLLIPGIDTVRVHGSSLFRLGHSYVAEDLDVVRDIATLVHLRLPPEQRRLRNGWPIPDPAPDERGVWVIGK